MIRAILTFLLAIISFSAVAQSVFSSGHWYRLQIGCNGIYRISYQKLKDLGYADPSSVRIFGYGMECRILNRDQYVYFYAKGPDTFIQSTEHQMQITAPNNYTDHSCYFLTDCNTQYNNQIESISCTNASSTATQGVFNYHHELSNYNLQLSGQRWFGERFSNTVTESIKFDCNNAPSSATIAAAFAARSGQRESFSLKVADTQHIVSLEATSDNGPYATTQTVTFNYTPQNTEKQTVDVSFLKNSSSATGYIDYISLQTIERLIYKSKHMIFRNIETNSQVTKFQVENLSASHIVMDITDDTPYIIEHSENGAFSAPTASNRRFAICAPNHALEPEYAGQVANQDLHSATDTEYLIVTPEKLKDYAHQIADLHPDLRCLVATDQQIYNEYSSGMRSATAIRDFARDLYERGGSLRYLLLFGDGSVDNLHDTYNNTNTLPTYQSVNSLNDNGLQSFVSDDYFGLLQDYNGEINGKLCIGVGRIPVNTGNEARISVQKISDYISAQRNDDFRKRIVFVADDENQNLHAQQAENLAELIESQNPEFDISKIYIDNYQQESSAAGDTYPGAREDFINSFRRGALVINYIGHGGMRFFADERILTTEDIENLQNADCLPVVITASCNIGHFDYYDYKSDKSTISPAEYLMLTPEGGAIAMLTTTREVSANQNHILHRNIISQMMNIGTRLGDIIREAKNATNDRNMLNFVLLGDPALKLAIPESKIEATSINGTDIQLFDGTLKAMETYTIECQVSDKENFSKGNAYITIYDKQRTATTLNNDGQGAFEFSEYGNTIFRGQSTLLNGKFCFTFTVPKDIDYAEGPIKISLYAESGNHSASGFNRQLILGGSSSNVSSDCVGPEISLVSLKDNGDDKILTIALSDESGINVTGASGHGITITDVESGKYQDITSLYKANTDSHTSGTISFETGYLGQGLHTILIKAWDNMNNPSERELRIAVTDDKALKIYNLRAYPNPCQGETTVDFAHNAQDGNAEYTISIISLKGQVVYTKDGTLLNGDSQIHIDFSEIHQQGMYIIRLAIRDNMQRTAISATKLLYMR